MAPVAPRMSKAEEATALRRELEDFCNDFEALKRFYEQVTPASPGNRIKDRIKDDKPVAVEGEADEEKTGDVQEEPTPI